MYFITLSHKRISYFFNLLLNSEYSLKAQFIGKKKKKYNAIKLYYRLINMGIGWFKYL